FIELQNVSSSPAFLFDPAHPENHWQLRGGTEFTFPSAYLLQPKAFLLIVGFDPLANPAKLDLFRAKYNVQTSTPVFGPFSGRLANRGALLELYKPDAPVSSGPDAGTVPYILIDRVSYQSQTPWPVDADGTSASLQRQNSDRIGNDPINWRTLA